MTYIKSHTHIFILLLMLTTSTPSAASTEGTAVYKDATAPIADRVEDLLNRMTLHEKVLQLQNRTAGSADNIANAFRGESYGTTHDMSQSAYDCAVMYRALQDYLRDNTRLGIPVITSVEGIQGVLQNGCTLFPQALAQGSTFNPSLITRMTEAAGEEAKAIGAHQILSPVFDIARELRWGRVEETYGEDPFLIAEMGIAFVKGYQKYNITCMPKHFVAHGSPTGGLNCASVSGGDHELRNLYLYPFRRVIQEAHPLAVMTCYSAYDGVAVTGSHYFLTDILRGELAFDGYIYSDWGSVERLMSYHHTVGSLADAARRALLAGLDLDIDSAYETLEQQVEDGQIDIEAINAAVRRILTVKFKLGLFEQTYGDPAEVLQVVHNDEKIALAKEVADESAILLENKNNILPLDMTKYKTFAIVGPNSAQTVLGDYAWTPADTHEGVTLLEGMQRVVGNNATILHAEGCDWWSKDTSHISEAVEKVEQSDIAIVAIGTRSTYLGREANHSTAGEGYDLSSLDLPGAQLDLLKEVKKTGKPMIVVLISGKPLVMSWVKENADAVLVQWYGGEQQGNTLADILCGTVNPSGHLNVSFPRSTGNTPCYYNYYPTDREEPHGEFPQPGPGRPDAPDGRYVFDAPGPLWAFGRGKSYTTFDYSSCTINKDTFTDGDTLVVDVTVRNTGQRDGKEVVQLYVHRQVSSIAMPIQQLKAFSKPFIKAGTEEHVQLVMPIAELRQYDLDKLWTVEKGVYEIQIGAASDDIRFRRVIVVE